MTSWSAESGDSDCYSDYSEDSNVLQDEYDQWPAIDLSSEENCVDSDRKHIECLRACLKGVGGAFVHNIR